MKFRKLIAFFVFVSFAVGAANAAAANAADVAQASQPAPRAVTDIVAKNIQARGGAEAWRAVQSVSMSGSMDAGKNLSLPFRLDLKRTKKMRLELDFNQTTAVQVFNGTKGSKLRRYLGRNEVEPMTPDELEAASSQADLDGLLFDYQAKGFRLEPGAAEDLDGHRTQRVDLYRGDKIAYQLWVDTDTGLEYRVQSRRKVRGVEKKYETYYSDFRKVGNVLIPFKMETEQVGVKGRHAMHLSSVLLNQPMPDQKFETPQ